MSLQTEYRFTLPKGLVDESGTLHRTGAMRLATARDEIEPLRDQRIKDANDPYLTVLVLGRVVSEIGTIDPVGPQHIEQLFAADLAFLQDFYGIINFGNPDELEALQRSVAPPVDTALEAPSGSAPEAPSGTAPEATEEHGDLDEAPRGRRGRVEEVLTGSEG